MNNLIRKLEHIQQECEVKQGLLSGNNNNDIGDDFTRLKHVIANELSETRELIKARDELELSAPGTRFIAEQSHNIRARIKQMKAEACSMAEIQRKAKDKYEKRNKPDITKAEKLQNRGEIVEVVFQHIVEVEALSKRKYGDSAFDQNGSSSSSSDTQILELPDNDIAEFQVLRQNDQTIDLLFRDISETVQTLREIAITSGNETRSTAIALENLDEKVRVVDEHLDNLNYRMHKALDSIRSGDRFCIDLILLCIVLGIGGYIYSIIVK